MGDTNQLNMTPWQTIALTILRITIGWHFLYEGLIKVFNPNWSALGFLNASQGPLAGLFKSLAANPGTVEVINQLNQWGLVLIGLSLMLGLLTRWACLGGIFILALYYLQSPPFIGIEASMAEGNYLIVNKNLVELIAFWVLYLFPSSHVFGMDRLLLSKRHSQ